MDSKNVQKVSIQELMQVAVKKYNINNDITFSKQAIEKFMRYIFHDKKSPYYSYIKKVSTKDRKYKFTYFIPVTKETVNLFANIIVLYNMAGPERYDEYLRQWKKQFYNINIYDNKKPLPFYYIEKVLSGYHEYYGEFQHSGNNYFRDAFEPEELKLLLDNMKVKYIEYIDKLFYVNYTRFYVEQNVII